MEQTLNQKISIVIKIHKDTNAHFCKLTGLSTRTLSGQISGANQVSVNTVIALLKTYPDISPDWLLLDEGEMFRTNNALFNQINENGSNIQGINVNTQQRELIDVIKSQDERLRSKDQQIERLLTKLFDDK